MKYYEEYISKSDSIRDILIYDKKEKKYKVGNNEVIKNNRGIVGDKVEYYKNEVINVIERIEHKICGIIEIGISYGLNEKGKKYYKFIPFKKYYPNFRVVSNIKKQGKYYVCITFKEWNITQNYPIGNIYYVDIENNSYEFLLYKYDLKPSKIIYSNTLKQKIQNDLLLNENIQIKNQFNYKGYTVDPLNSRDFDDAIYNINRTFYVYITNPLSYLNNELYQYIFNNSVSLYTHNKVINMYPIEYSDNILSLKENTIKYCKIFIIKYKENYDIEYIKVENDYVKIIKNYDYDSYDKIIKEDNYRKKLMEKYNLEDSHKYIEYFMILVNKYVSKILLENKDNIYRYIEDNIGKYGYKKIKHEILDDYYSHCTSPIRRIIDNYILGLLDKKLLNIDLEKINNKMNITKKYYYSLNRLKLIEDLEKKYKEKESIIENGIIEKINDKNIIIKINNYKIKENYKNYIYKDLKIGENVKLNIIPFFNNLYYKDKIKINIIT
jgi:exoribonuclease R